MILIQFHEDCATEDPSPKMWIIDSTQHLQISKWHEALTAAVGRLIWATGRILTHQQLPKTTTRPAVTSCYIYMCLQLLSLQLFPLKKSRQSCSLSLLQRKTNKQKPAPRRKLEFVDGESGGLSKERMQVTVWAYIDKLSDDAQRQMAEGRNYGEMVEICLSGESMAVGEMHISLLNVQELQHRGKSCCYLQQLPVLSHDNIQTKLENLFYNRKPILLHAGGHIYLQGYWRCWPKCLPSHFQ